MRIQDFGGATWSLDSIGPELLDPSVLARIEREILAGGRLVPVSFGAPIPSLRSEDALHRRFARSPVGLDPSLRGAQ